jgi:hypothetical protein
MKSLPIDSVLVFRRDHIEAHIERLAYVLEKPAPGLIRGGSRFSDKEMRHSKESTRL